MKVTKLCGIIIFLLFICHISQAQTVDITAQGYIEIYDPEHPSATFDVYVCLETVDNQYFQSQYGANPVLSNANTGSHFINYLFFDDVDEQEVYNGYRIVLCAVRISPSSQTRYGFSNWSAYNGLYPWSPSPIKITAFD